MFSCEYKCYYINVFYINPITLYEYLFNEYELQVFFIVKVNESQYIALFVVSGSIKRLSQLIMSIFIFSQYFFQYILPGMKI